MSTAKDALRSSYVGKAQAEFANLDGRGCIMSGNAFSSVLFVKGELSPTDINDGLLQGEDGQALRSSLAALGYSPEDWAALAAVDVRGELLSAELAREAIACFDPATIVLCDSRAAELMQIAYPQELAAQESFEAAMLEAGSLASICGIRVLALGGFADALALPEAKQLMWARLKKIPPLGEPF